MNQAQFKSDMNARQLSYAITINGCKPEIVAIARACMRAGLSEVQSILIARLARTAECQFDWDVMRIAQGIRAQARTEHAEGNPRGKWTVLSRRYPQDWGHMANDDPRTAAWANHQLDNSYITREAQACCVALNGST